MTAPGPIRPAELLEDSDWVLRLARSLAREEAEDLVAILEGTTDAQGRYRFSTLEPGPIRLDVRAERLGPANDPVSLFLPAQGEVRQDFVLLAGVAILGLVVDAESGDPVPGATVGVGWALEKRTRTDADGRYSLSGLARQGFDELHVLAEGYARGLVRYESAGAGELVIDVALRRGFSAHGRVLEAAGGPLEGAFVAAVSRLTEALAERPADWRSTTTDATGFFTLADLRHDQEHALLVVNPGHGTRVLPFPDAETRPARVEFGDIRMFGAAQVCGRVVDEGRRGVPYCRLRISYAERHFRLGRNSDQTNPWNDDVAYVGDRILRSDSEGRFRFADLEAGDYVIDVSRHPLGALTVTEEFDGVVQARVAVSAGQALEELEIELPLNENIAGRVVDPEGEPVASMMIWLSPVASDAGPDLNQVTRADGRFEFRGLEPGAYRLHAYATSIGAAADEPAFLTLENVPVESGNTELELVLRPVPPTRGVVLGADGAPSVNASVMAFDAAGQRVDLSYTDTEGRFVLTLPVELTVCVIARPAPADAPFWDQAAVSRIPRTLAVERTGVAAGDEGLVLRLPDPMPAPIVTGER